MQMDLDWVMKFDSTGDTSGQDENTDAEFAAALEELAKLDQ
jgi:hypothetical protein